MNTYMTLPEVCELTRLGRSTIVDKVRVGEFPVPRKLGKSKRARIVWSRTEVEAWIEGNAIHV